MSSSLFVGIGVSHKHNVVYALDNQGQQVGKKTSFPNNLPGAEQLEQWIVEKMHTAGAEDLIVGTEATSFYDFHVMEHLAQSPLLAHLPPSLYRLNAKLVRNFKKALRSPHVKNDPKDAFAIAMRLRMGDLPAAFRPQLLHLPLQRLARFRAHTAKSLAREGEIEYFSPEKLLPLSTFPQVQRLHSDQAVLQSIRSHQPSPPRRVSLHRRVDGDAHRSLPGVHHQKREESLPRSQEGRRKAQASRFSLYWAESTNWPGNPIVSDLLWHSLSTWC